MSYIGYNILVLVIHRLATVSKKPPTSRVTVVAGLLLTLDHYQPQILLKLHIKYCTLDDKIVATITCIYTGTREKNEQRFTNVSMN